MGHSGRRDQLCFRCPDKVSSQKLGTQSLPVEERQSSWRFYLGSTTKWQGLNHETIVINPGREGTQQEKERYSTLGAPTPLLRVRYWGRAATHELTQEGNWESTVSRERSLRR